MSELKATPGPWEFIDGETNYENDFHRRGGIRSVEGEWWIAAIEAMGDVSTANAHLIAASPVMYSYIADMPCPNSCTPCRSKPYDSEDVYKGCPFCIQRHAVLAKARGEQ